MKYYFLYIIMYLCVTEDNKQNTASPDSDSEDRGFESRRVCQQKPPEFTIYCVFRRFFLCF